MLSNRSGVLGAYVYLENNNHFDSLDELENPDSLLSRLIAILGRESAP